MSKTNAYRMSQCGTQCCCPLTYWDQEQTQLQEQLQAQGQDQDQTLRTIVRDIGNNTFNITIDNENILVAVLVLVEVLLGGDPDVSALRTYLEQRANQNTQNTQA